MGLIYFEFIQTIVVSCCHFILIPLSMLVFVGGVSPGPRTSQNQFRDKVLIILHMVGESCSIHQIRLSALMQILFDNPYFDKASLTYFSPLAYNRPASLGSVVGAVVGGVGLLLNHEPTLMFQKAGMLSPEGRCKTLDASADG